MTARSPGPASPYFALTDRTVLVTGAAGGIGAAIADGLHALGARVVGSSRDPSTAARLADRYGTQPCVLDLRTSGRWMRHVPHCGGTARSTCSSTTLG